MLSLFNLIAIILLIIICLYSILYYYYKYWYRILLLSKNFLGPPALPIIGNGLTFIGIKSDDILPLLYGYVEQYGERFKIWLGPELNIHTMNVGDAEGILSKIKYSEKASEYKVLKPWLREGLLISNKQKWFKRRKIITPAFHFQILEKFCEIFDNQSFNFIDNMSKIKNKDYCDLLPLINLYTLDVICETAMGVKINAQKNSDSEYVKAVKTISSVLYQRMTNSLYRYDFIFNLTPLCKLQNKALKIIHEFSENIIISRREEILKNQFTSNENLENLKNSSKTNTSNNPENTKNYDTNIKQKKCKMAFLDILLQSKIDNEPLKNLDIREEVDTFMFEGHDTTTSAIHFLLYFLGSNPDKQQKCYEEILKVLSSNSQTNDDQQQKQHHNSQYSSKSITYENLHDLRYIELCIKETLRLCPSVPIFGRKITQESTINGNTYPAGTNIGITTFGMNRLEYLYSEPLKFIPERFISDKSTDKLNPYSYIPFSAGPRNCIGQKFAILEIKNIITRILINYEIEYVGDINGPKFTFELILRCSNILWFKLKPRQPRVCI